MAILPSPVIITDVDGNSITAATQATLASVLTELQSILTKLNDSLAVTGAFYQATQPVSLATAPTTPVTNANLDVALSTLATVAAHATLLTELQAKTEPADQQHVIVDSAPASASAADVTTVDADAGYTDGATGEPLTQTLDGRLRAVVSALVSDARESYLDGAIRSLSMTSDGRLRVASSPSIQPSADDLTPPFSSTDMDGGYTFPREGAGIWI